MQDGYIDMCMQSHCAGWAVKDGMPAALELFVNNQKLLDIDCDIARPDLAAHGHPIASGFSVVFPQPLRSDDTVDVRFKGGGSLQNSPTVKHGERLAALLAGIDPAERGLELGPLDRPILGKRDYDVRYVDHATRADLIDKYRQTGSGATVRPDQIATVDFVWDRRLIDVTGGGYGFCLASHVIEHVADPIGWLGEIADVLKPGGRLNLAVPEKTRTFDHQRMPSTPAAMLEAHQRKLRRPSFGQIFDHIAGASPFGEPPADRLAAARSAYRVACAVEGSGAYLDVHCHVWTHETFQACWDVIEALELVPLRLARLNPPFSDWNEFTVSFVRM